MDKRALSKEIQITNLLREIDRDFPVQYYQTFLYIALNEGLTMRDLEAHTGLAQSSTSRSVAAMSEVNAYGKPGHNLVRQDFDPLDSRRKLIYLTPKGKELVEKIQEILKR